MLPFCLLYVSCSMRGVRITLTPSLFHPLPQLTPLHITIQVNRTPILPDYLLYFLETLAKLVIGLAQCLFCVNIEPARRLRHNKKNITHLLLLVFWRSRFLYFLYFLMHLLQQILNIGKLETNSCSTLLVLLRHYQSRCRQWHTIQHTLLLHIFARRYPFLLLDLLPVH